MGKTLSKVNKKYTRISLNCFLNEINTFYACLKEQFSTKTFFHPPPKKDSYAYPKMFLH